MGDLWILRPNNPKTLCTVTPAYVKKHKKNDIWLPRQDQLQEMAEYRSIGKNLELLSEFWNTKYCYDNFTTMEQLWLAFVMSEKYSKKWIDDEWKEM